MFPDDDPPADQPSRLTHVIYNAALGHVRVRSDESLVTTVEVPQGEVRFRRVLGASEPQAALWLDSIECDALARLLDYCTRELRIAPEYQATVATVQAKVAELGALTTFAGQAEGEDATPRPPIVLPPEPAIAPVEAHPAETPAAPAHAATAAPTAARPATPRRPAGRRGAQRGAPAGSPDQAAPGAAATPVPAATPAASPGAGAAAASAPEAAGGEPARPAAHEKAAPAATRSGPPRGFMDVWRDLRRLGDTQPELHALAGQVSSAVREVTDDGIWVYSHGIGRTYCVQRNQLEAAWKALTAAGRLAARDLSLSQGAVTLLAHLPYVEYSAQPLTLHYTAEATHPLGTIVRRDGNS